MPKLVRIAPHNPRHGYKRRRHIEVNPGPGLSPMSFDVAKGWYEVEDEVAEKLAKIPQEERFPKGPKVFLVADDAEEAKALEAEMAALLKDEDEEEPGSPTAPIKASRPGTKKAASVPKPRTRTRAAAPAKSEEKDEDADADDEKDGDE